MTETTAELSRRGRSEAASAREPVLHQDGQLILPLTSVRFIAALMVLFFHTLPESLPRTGIPGALYRSSVFGHTAVAFFFVLSGFILATVYPAIPDAATLRRFLVARLARIYPVYITCMLVDVHRLAAHRVAKYGLQLGLSMTGATFLLEASMLSAFVPDVAPIDGPSWSIPVEFWFYLSFPWIIGRVSWRGRRSALWWTAIFAALYALVITPPALVYALYDVVPDQLELLVGRNPIFRIPEFVIGVFLARLAVSPSSRFRVAATAALVLGAAGCCAVIALCTIEFKPLRSALIVPFFALMILGLTVSRGWTMKALSIPFLVLLGEASYALYLIHLPLWEAFKPFGADTALPIYAAYVACAIATSVVLYWGIERPCRVWLRRRFAPAPDTHVTA